MQLIQITGSRRGGMADALGSGPSSFTGVGVQLPPTAPKYSVKNCGYGITAVHQPSKLVIGVRPPLPAPLSSVGFPSGQRGQTVNLLAQLSMVRIHLPPPLQKQRTSTEVLFFCGTGGDHGFQPCKAWFVSYFRLIDGDCSVRGIMPEKVAVLRILPGIC